MTVSLPGAVILDTSAVKVLVADPIRHRLLESLTACDLELLPSAINVLEILKFENLRKRDQLLRAIATVVGHRSLLPLPTDLLGQVGRALVQHSTDFVTEASGFEWVIHEPERIQPAHIAGARDALNRNEIAWREAHQLARKEIRARLRKHPVRDPWGSIPMFLDQQWTTLTMLGDSIERLWLGMELSSQPPFDLILHNEAWRLYYEGTGATVYERCVPNQSPKPAHVADVVQLAYLAARRRRVFVTDDAGLARVANAVLRGRYPQTRVLSVSELLALAD